MPTGYTAEILDGKVKDFNQFAILCMRAFGATIHMRDESLEQQYEPRTPSEYHVNKIQEEKQKLALAEEISDKDIIELREQELLRDRSYNIEAKAKAESNFILLKTILTDAVRYKPPTGEHTGIKRFMMQQLEDTIRMDCSTEYYDDNLAKIESELNNLNAKEIRSKMKIDAYKSLAYHEKELKEDIERCNKSNKWVEQLLTSLPKQ